MSTAPEIASEIAPEAVPDHFPLELDEYCTRLSLRDKRVALIGAFHFTMKQRGMKVADEADWDREFKALATTPVVR